MLNPGNQCLLKINGTPYHNGNVIKGVNSHLLKDLSNFLLKWYDPSDTISIKTSGTTGKPKLIKLSKTIMLDSALKTCDFFGLNSDSTLLLCLSADFIAGKMMIVRAIACGANLLLANKLDEPLYGINQTIDFLSMVPMQLQQQLKNPDSFNNVKTALIGGSPISEECELQLQEQKTHFFHSYGMTETASHVAVRHLNGASHSDIYTAFPEIRFSINDSKQLIVNAPQINKTPLLTNDVVDLLDEQSFRWIGRIDNVINSGGIKFFPEQIESKLKDSIDTLFYVHWVNDTRLGQKIVLILQSDSLLSHKELEHIFNDRLERHEKPRQIIYKSHIRLTSTGKIIRQ